MAERFFDTSAAVKHYRVELGTPKVDALLADPGSRHYLSTLGVIEMHSVFARPARKGQITAAEFHRLRGLLAADIAAGLWQVVQVVPADYQQAQQLLVRHAVTRSLFTMDALQLALALALHVASPLDAFVCSDANLGPLAALEGLTLINPEVP
jgi:hypothetical protein